ncbi:hypothetical protein MSAN_01772100 [Mycena sanguinolenta]|uniref:Uncharacterized protein n=1 Tax=Mycena sanguinolenta TaxID=230812 RepID=A0A8H7CU76_9AGAR|nr:hypothetical protein MSAN_01772100 [Mycena sanguinolenta]
MASSESSLGIIPWNPEANKAIANVDENSRPEGGKWAVFLNAVRTPTPGRTLDQMYTGLGRLAETQANRAAYALGLGPQVVSQKIKNYFGEGEKMVQQLELLRTSVPSELEKKCLKLMEYALPKESANMQYQAFKNIVDLITLFPGLRLAFLRTKFLESAPAAEAISRLWDRPFGSPDKDWEFWQILATTCLTHDISVTIQKSSVSALLKCQQEEDLSLIEKLLVQHDCSHSPYSNALCIRYLAGILGFPGFWEHMDSIHGQATNKLSSRLIRVLKDIGVDILELVPTSEPETPFDYEGVDLLALNLLTGVLGWFNKLDQKDWPTQLWYENFRTVVQLLQMPRASDLLPSSSDYTSNFEEMILITYEEAEVPIKVHDQNQTTDPPNEHHRLVLFHP